MWEIRNGTAAGAHTRVTNFIAFVGYSIGFISTEQLVNSGSLR